MNLVTRSALACLIGSLIVAAGACQARPGKPAASKGDAAPANHAAPAAQAAAGIPDASPPPAGPYHVLAPLTDTAAFDGCASDGECAVAALRCCDCAHGGLGVAIARSKLAEWPASSCTDPTAACNGTPSGDPTCRGAARCLNGHCRLTVQASDLTAPGEPGKPPAPTVRPTSTGSSTETK